MPDETTVSPAPVDTPIPQAPETLNPVPAEAVVAPAPVEAPAESVPAPEPIPEEQTAHLGGNEPFEPAPIESIPSVPTVETPVAVAEPVTGTPSETIAVETSAPVQAPTEAPLVAPVETPAPAQIPEPVIQASAPETTPTPTQAIATVVAPVIATTITQTFTKSIRELFTKAQLTIQNRKRKKIDRVLTLFAKQTMITNNEVEKLLHVSDATATRYLSALEKEGKIKQNKKTGKGVSYSKIQLARAQ